MKDGAAGGAIVETDAGPESLCRGLLGRCLCEMQDRRKQTGKGKVGVKGVLRTSMVCTSLDHPA